MKIHPGDLLKALVTMRGWESFNFRGCGSQWIDAGQLVIVVQVVNVGSGQRIQALLDGKLGVFATATYNARYNWELVDRHTDNSPVADPVTPT